MNRQRDRELQMAALEAAVAAGWKVEVDPVRIRARYADFNRAEQVPRAIMYVDIGFLVGHVQKLEAFLIENGYQLVPYEK